MNIIIYTNHYVDPINEGTTKVVHYFAKEWVKQGNEVVVIHNRMRKFLFDKKISKKKYTKLDGVRIVLNDIIRFIPKSTKLFNFQYKKILKNIEKNIGEFEFRPDLLIVHFPSSQWEIIKRTEHLFNCPVIPVFHNIDIKNTERSKEILKSVLIAGYRSKVIQEKLIELNLMTPLFPVNSGVPTNIIEEKVRTNKRTNFIYAGNLIRQKNVDYTIKALNRVKNEYNFRFDIYGTGPQEKHLKKMTKDLKLTNHVFFHARISRNEILQKFRTTDCFIMASKPETLGLVYLEAMATGNFVIGSKDQGIDGIIVDGYNGLLTTPQSINDLEKNIRRYLSMSENELNSILENSLSTVQSLTETKASKNYLKFIKKGLEDHE